MRGEKREGRKDKTGPKRNSPNGDLEKRKKGGGENRHRLSRGSLRGDNPEKKLKQILKSPHDMLGRAIGVSREELAGSGEGRDAGELTITLQV